MTADIVNLRRVRKQNARAEKEEMARANRTRHGLSKAERHKAEAEQERARRQLDGHRRDE